MATYNFSSIEKKWQERWKEQKTYEVTIDPSKPKYYVLDMFPYPSGKGLHVGHPLGYIATDIVARYKRLKGYNVLHPMGFDSFGLPAEQHAIKTGENPAHNTDINIKRYKEQLSSLGFSYDSSREIRTSDPSYYKWTQWIFLQLFKNDLAYIDDTMVNWCPNHRVVLSNEEVKNGRCERCNTPVVRKKMKQWVLKITQYADRLIQDLDDIDWPESVKLSQKNWIGRSKGAEIEFQLEEYDNKIKVYTTRPDTIFGVTYLVLAPEHDLVAKVTTKDQKEAVDEYIDRASKKSDLERTELDKTKTGVFTGSYALNPISGGRIPVWVSDYVLISYGTGSVMAVPGGDQRDFDFAKKFDLPIIVVISPDGKEIEDLREAYPGHGKVLNSGEYNGIDSKEMQQLIIDRLEKESTGKGAVNYKLRDWIFSRQRYWGEPIPLIHCESCGIVPVPENQLPVVLPEIKSYSPAEDGRSPLAKVSEWVNTTCPSCGQAAKRETNTMPQWGGSCWYYLRYLDPKNNDEFIAADAEKYWMNVDFYLGGAEHAVLHLLYARFWHKFLYDIGKVHTKEPFQKLINQGMIQGRSSLAYRVDGTNQYVSKGLKNNYKASPVYVDVNIVKDDVMDVEAFRSHSSETMDAQFVLEDGKFICDYEVEKMSKSKYNVINPDELVKKYGADTLRMYEMFLGPIEQSKPWNTNGIDGVFKFIKRFWALFHDGQFIWSITDEKPSKAEYKILYSTLQKSENDINRLSLNTVVSNYMIAVNELTALKCKKRRILEPLVIGVAPFAPHIAEELWCLLGHQTSVVDSSYPKIESKYLQEDNFEYPVSINGKVRVKLTFAYNADKKVIEEGILANEIVQKWTKGRPPKKVIIVPNRIVNVVV